jgi:hypothetical protein
MENTGFNLTDLKYTIGVYERAFSLILEELQGVVVDIPEGMEFYGDIRKVVVYKHQDKMQIQTFLNDEVPAGAFIQLTLEEESPIEE